MLAPVALLLLSSAQAASFDPELTWRTLHTEHFRVTFHQGEEALAEEISLVAEDVFAELTPDLRWQTRRKVEILVVDRTDSANGYAGTVPYPRIVLFATAPEGESVLGLYEEWTRTILTHELTHVLHLDTNHGVVRLARYVVGRVASTNEISPRWMVEGLATYEETEHTSGGRGRTPLAEMILRTSALEGQFPPLGNLDGYQPDPPGGNLRYLFGEDFIRYVADQQGEDVWTRWIHTYGSTIPYILPTKRSFGELLVPLYTDWKLTRTTDALQVEARVEAEGSREGVVISQGDASCAAPSFSPDGTHLVWSCFDLQEGSRIVMADGSGANPEILTEKIGADSFTWRRDSKAFVYAGMHIVNRFNTWSDVYLFDLESKKPVPLTQGKRARDPDFSPDGSRLVVVTNRVSNNQLEVMTVDRILDPLTDLDDHTQFSSPRHSPDGRVLAVTVWQDGQRDLWLYTPEGAPVRRLTLDRALEREPAWSADGRWLYFSSDRSGIPNIYAIDTASERLWQVTNVATGAVFPTIHPDGTRLAYQQYSHDGWDVRIMPLDPATFIDRGDLPRPIEHGAPIASLTSPVAAPVPDAAAAWEGETPTKLRWGVPVELPYGLQSPGEVIDTFEESQVEDVFGEEAEYPFTYPVKRYNPLPTLVPRFWIPYVQVTPDHTPDRDPSPFLPFGVVLSAATGSSDMAAHFGWSASLSYRTDANFLGGGVAFTYNRFLPVFTISAVRRVVPYTLILQDAYHIGPDGVPDLAVDATCSANNPERCWRNPYWDQRHEAAFTVSFPYAPKASAFGQYVISFRDNKDPIPADAYYARIPVRGSLGRISGGWRYAWAEPTPYAISREDGRIFSVVASFLSPYLGTRIKDEQDEFSPLTQVQLTTEWNEYVVNPWVPNHVLAWRLAAGAAIGGTDFLGTYQLGGSIGDSPFYATPDEARMLRGYPFGADVGDYYWLAGAEYRFPLWRIERGVGTIPAYMRWFSAAAFVDAGNAFTSVDDVDQVVQGTLLGVGAELRFSAILGWNLGVSGRLGYATGIGPFGYDWNDPRTLYFQFGGSF